MKHHPRARATRAVTGPQCCGNLEGPKCVPVAVQATESLSLEQARFELHRQPVLLALEDLERPRSKIEHEIAFGFVEFLPDLVAADPTHCPMVSQNCEGTGPVEMLWAAMGGSIHMRATARAAAAHAATRKPPSVVFLIFYPSIVIQKRGATRSKSRATRRALKASGVVRWRERPYDGPALTNCRLLRWRRSEQLPVGVSIIAAVLNTDANASKLSPSLRVSHCSVVIRSGMWMPRRESMCQRNGPRINAVAVLETVEPAFGDCVDSVIGAGESTQNVRHQVSVSPPRLTTSVRASSKESVVIKR